MLPERVSPGSRDNAVNVRVQTKILSPCMQYAHGTGFNAETGIAELAQCVPNAGEQRAVKPFAVNQAYCV